MEWCCTTVLYHVYLLVWCSVVYCIVLSRLIKFIVLMVTSTAVQGDVVQQQVCPCLLYCTVLYSYSYTTSKWTISFPYQCKRSVPFHHIQQCKYIMYMLIPLYIVYVTYCTSYMSRTVHHIGHVHVHRVVFCTYYRYIPVCTSQRTS